MSIKYGILNEVRDEELRVGLTPDVAARILKQKDKDIELVLEKGAGIAATFEDKVYEAVGVKVKSRDEVLKSDVIGFIEAPNADTISKLKKGQIVVGLFGTFSNSKIVDEFKKAQVTAIDLNRLPRQLSMAQSMDAMTSQASVAGYKAVLLAASEYAGFFPMLSTAAGTVKPASVLVLGAGIAGLQAIGTAKRLGAVVTAFDVRPTSEEEILSLGGKFLDLGKYGAADVVAALKEGQGEGGYARALTNDELAAQKKATDLAVKDFDVVITTAQVPGKKPPEFVSKKGLEGMKPGSVVIDLAASNLGGNVEGSKPNETTVISGVKVIGAGALASTSARAASDLLARNIAEVILHFINKDTFSIGASDELATMVVAGELSSKKDLETTKEGEK